MPPIQPPTGAELRERLGPAVYEVWQKLTALIETEYEMDTLWGISRKAGDTSGDYEFKYRRGGKTLCSLYLRKGSLGFMVIYGRAEQEKFEAQRSSFSGEITSVYEATRPYHDGRWMMLELTDGHLLSQLPALLHIKRKPNRKT